MAVVELRNIWKTYLMGETEVHALREVNFTLEKGQMVAVMGPSGSGKSTLLNLVGCLDQPTRGEYMLGGRNVAELDDDQLSEIRAAQIGFVFQSYNLIPQLTVVENIEIPLYYLGVSERESYERAVSTAEKVGLSHRLSHVPTELSGGERQRVGIARAMASSPLFILADEPTGNLDTKTGRQIMELLHELNGDGVTMIIVTHDTIVAEQCERFMLLQDGTMREVPGPGIGGTRAE
jgi:putative ABC transport system ATP-binding protein